MDQVGNSLSPVVSLLGRETEHHQLFHPETALHAPQMVLLLETFRHWVKQTGLEHLTPVFSNQSLAK